MATRKICPGAAPSGAAASRGGDVGSGAPSAPSSSCSSGPSSELALDQGGVTATADGAASCDPCLGHGPASFGRSATADGAPSCELPLDVRKTLHAAAMALLARARSTGRGAAPASEAAARGAFPATASGACARLASARALGSAGDVFGGKSWSCVTTPSPAAASRQARKPIAPPQDLGCTWGGARGSAVLSHVWAAGSEKRKKERGAGDGEGERE